MALGVLYLPELIKELSPREAAELVAWQYRQYMTQVEMLKEMSPDLEAIGCSAREAFETGRKEALAIQLLADQMGKDAHVVDFFLRIADFKVEMAFPHKPNPTPCRPVFVAPSKPPRSRVTEFRLHDGCCIKKSGPFNENQTFLVVSVWQPMPKPRSIWPML